VKKVLPVKLINTYGMKRMNMSKAALSGRAFFVVLVLIVCFGSHHPANAAERDLDWTVSSFAGNVGIYAKNLRTRQEIRVNADTVFPTASTNKLVAAMGVYKYLYDKVPEAEQAHLEGNVERMMRISDNAAYFDSIEAIRAVYGEEILEHILRNDLKLEATYVNSQVSFAQYQYSSVTTPYEMGEVFEKLYDGKYLGEERSKRMLDYLAHTVFNDEIPRFFSGTLVMHKIGSLDDYLNDVGIVQIDQDPILISVFTRTDEGEDYASHFIAAIAYLLAERLSSRTDIFRTD